MVVVRESAHDVAPGVPALGETVEEEEEGLGARRRRVRVVDDVDGDGLVGPAEERGDERGQEGGIRQGGWSTWGGGGRTT